MSREYVDCRTQAEAEAAIAQRANLALVGPGPFDLRGLTINLPLCLKGDEAYSVEVGDATARFFDGSSDVRMHFGATATIDYLPCRNRLPLYIPAIVHDFG